MMNTKDAVYWAGLMAGVCVGFLAIRSLGFGQIWQLLGGIAVGVGVGYVAEQMFVRRND